jgi:hypothetical protein
MADSCTGFSLPQYVLGFPFSLNMVPPTATLKGVEAIALTEMGLVAGGVGIGSAEDFVGRAALGAQTSASSG